MRIQNAVVILILVLVVIQGGCRKQQQTEHANSPPYKTTSPSPSPPTAANEPEQSVIDCIKAIPFLEPGERAGMLTTWKRVANYRNYRMVRRSDFDIPGWVKNEIYAEDVERATGWSHDYGELGGAYGLVLFMVDKTKSDPNRFSVAVLIRRPANRFDQYWIFQNANLSRVNLRRHSGDAYLEEFRDNQTSSYCDIQWNRRLKRWACELN
jgi:hypothetical protein